jgi:predicted dithiol-disulfide oxidoreductase (DUF899 family)
MPRVAGAVADRRLARGTFRAMNPIRFPGESDAYRAARDELLEAERELRLQTERVAALRRTLPPGGQVAEDYVFEDGVDAIRQVKLSDLFGDKQTLVLYSFMYGPNAKAPCPLCTSFLDALEAQAEHIEQQVALAVVAKSPSPRIRGFTDRRGWKRLRLLSSHGSTYHRDYHGELADGTQMPMMNVFTRKDGTLRHFWGSELLYATDREAEGIDSRHIDILWPLWNVLDLTPGGRGSTWYPQLSYER